jgi:apolipoprotein N-acyltransferase
MTRWAASFERHPRLSGLLSVPLLTLAAAPFGQWYLAWIALVPWLIAVGRAPTLKSAFVYGWATGTIYFALNEWWLWTATISGTIGVVVCSGFYWGLAAVLIYYLRVLPRANGADSSSSVAKDSHSFAPLLQTVGIAAIWVTTEWLRCNTVSEFPWLPIGSTQTSAIAICQIADLTGIWGVSFLVVLVNALLATAGLSQRNLNRLWLPSSVVALALLIFASYGIWRLRTTPDRPGPQVMLIQSNHPHVRGGASTTTPEEAANYFLDEVDKQLAHKPADLVILPERELTQLKDEARTE